MEEGGSRDLVRALARGQLDLALIIMPLQSDDPSLVTEEILRENLVRGLARRTAARASRTCASRTCAAGRW